MLLKILNAEEELLGIIDEYRSLIWTRRFYECGDFELYCKASEEILSLLLSGTFIARDDDEQICLIENIQVDTDVEEGNYIIVSGRCMKSILDRRIVWYQTTLYAPVDTFLRMILEKHLISPKISSRKIENFTYVSSGDLTDYVEMQLDGDNLYDVIVPICKQVQRGFEVELNEGSFRMRLFKGVDRSYAQTENPFVVFSADFDNLAQSSYTFSNAVYKNVALVKGEGSGTGREAYTVGSASGLTRREVYTDAQTITDNGGGISESNYNKLLSAVGERTLANSRGSEAFEGTVIDTGQYVYKQDYFLGDIVQVRNEFGIEARARILEIIESDDETGYSIIPKFSTWEVTQ